MMTRIGMTAAAVIVVAWASATAPGAEDEAPPESAGPAIENVTGVAPKPDAFKPRGWKTPTEIGTADEAKAFFGEKQMEKLLGQVNFEKQKVLVFAWRGSGGDRLSYSVAGSFPEQVTFEYRGGRTRDLRPHVHVFALRKNVTWRVSAGR